MLKASRWPIAALLIGSTLRAQAPVGPTTVFNTTLPSDRCASSVVASHAFLFGDIANYVGTSFQHGKRTTACSSLISGVPKLPSAYLDCDNWRCQVIGGMAAKGVIGGVEERERAAFADTLGSTLFGLGTSLVYYKVDSDRKRLDGGHRLSVLLLGLELRLPVQPFTFQRLCVSPTYSMTGSNPFGASSSSNGSESMVRPWTSTLTIACTNSSHNMLGAYWLDRYFNFGPLYVPVPAIGTAPGMYVGFTHSNRVERFSVTESRSSFSDFVNRPVKPVDDDPDWAWLASRAAHSFDPVQLGSAWRIELETPGFGTSAGIASAEVRGLIAGNAASHYKHSESQLVDTTSVNMTARIWRRYTVGDTLTVDANVQAGLRVRINAFRFSYTRDISLNLPAVSSRKGTDWTAAEYSVVGPYKSATDLQYTLSACPAGVIPPPQPAHIPTDSPPANSNDPGPNLTQFATGVGEKINGTYQICSDSVTSGKTYDPTKDPGFLRILDKWKTTTDPALLATACEEVRQYLDPRAFACVKPDKQPLFPWSRMIVRRSRCQVMPG